jgi:L-alanine-DL-glutamate epimerase-like enolase superfamily enzyme
MKKLSQIAAMAIKIDYVISSLPFEYPFTISGGRTKTVQQALIVRINLDNVQGFGEAPAIIYYNIPIEKMILDLENHKDFLETLSPENPSEFYTILLDLFPENSFLRCALDMAFWDAYGKIKNLPIFALIGAMWKNDLPITDYTLGIDSLSKLTEKIKAHPWPIYKIKVGNENDIANLIELRNYFNHPFRLDANAGWTVKEAEQKIETCINLNIELIEQPLSINELHLMPQLKSTSKIPLFADESCVHEKDVEKCIAGFHGINIKLTKCGGITPALRMIQNARKNGLLIMVGSMNESSIGSAAIANLLPLIDYVDMDGPLLLTEDLASGLKIQSGKIELSGMPGLGIKVFDDVFQNL